MDENMLLNLALDAGEIMLSSGAETHRVEDTMERILSVHKNVMPEAFVTPTGLFAGAQGMLSGSRTRLKRITSSAVNLEKIHRVNSLSRNFVNGKITIDEAFEEIERIHALKDYPKIVNALCYGGVCSAFVIMLSPKSYKEAFFAIFVGFILGTYRMFANRLKLSGFLMSLTGGGIIAAAATALYYFGFIQSYDTLIIGSIMPLLPGLAFTNAVRDIMGGDYLSGTARTVESIMISSAIATGVGIVLKLSSIMGVL